MQFQYAMLEKSHFLLHHYIKKEDDDYDYLNAKRQKFFPASFIHPFFFPSIHRFDPYTVGWLDDLISCFAI